MAVLKNFPIVSQLTNVTSDGQPSENAQMDCVAASIGAAILYYQGKTQWDKDINPDRLKDVAMGQGYKGGTAASAYVDFCKSLGFKLYPFNGNPGQLVSEIHKQLTMEHPVIVTVPDVYVPSSYGWSHVLCAYGDGNGTITCLDPYIAKPLTKSDQEWLNLLSFNQIWILQKEDDFMPIDIHSPGIAAEFVETDAHHWRSKKTDKVVQFGMLAEFKAKGYSAGWGHPMSNEIYYAPGKSKQYFEKCVAGWDKATGKVGLLNLYDGGPGTDPELVKLQASPPDTSALQAQLDTAVKHASDLEKKIQVAADALKA